MDHATKEVRQVLQRFQDGYSTRDLAKLDTFMDLFCHEEEIELIGIGASVRGGNEWFQGLAQVREIVESDWKYWGDVTLDVAGAKITVRGETAWLSTSGVLAQTLAIDESLGFYLRQMKALLEDEDVALEARLVEATHFGMRRLRERTKGEGYGWPFVLTAVLLRTESGWRFHTIHWSMPVD